MIIANASRLRSWLALLAALLLAVPVSSWAIGRSLEAQLQAYRQPLLNAVPWLHVVARRYRQRVFSSREELDVEIDIAAVPRRFTIVNELQHGPFAGSLIPALASIRSTVTLPASSDAAVRRLFGDRSPVTVLTTLALLGGGHSEVTVPELDTIVGEDRSHVTWQGFRGELEFSRQSAHVEARASAPLLRVESATGEKVELGGLTLSSHGDRIFEDFYAGSVEVTLDVMRVVQRSGLSIDAADVRYSGAVPVSGEFVDLLARISARRARISGVDYGPARYDVSFRHLHGPSLARLTREFQRVAERTQQELRSSGLPPPPADAALRSALRQLLLAQPRLVIDHISASTPQGPFSVTGEAHFVGLDGSDLATPSLATLLPKLEAQADLSVPAAWADRAGATALAGKGATTADSELDALVRRGFVERRGELVITRVELRQGKLLLNGRAFGD